MVQNKIVIHLLKVPETQYNKPTATAGYGRKSVIPYALPSLSSPKYTAVRGSNHLQARLIYATSVYIYQKGYAADK
jgi:hypothetical protein